MWGVVGFGFLALGKYLFFLSFFPLVASSDLYFIFRVDVK